MTSYIVVSLVTGILFGALDGLINANPFARRLNEVYKPIAKTTLNIISPPNPFFPGLTISVSTGRVC